MTAPLFDVTAERAVIGAALLEPSVLERVELESRHFAGIQERVAWQTMLDMRAEGVAVDPILVAERSNLAYSMLSQCLLDTVTADNAEFYANVVREYAITRAVLMATEGIKDMHRRGEAAGSELLGAALKSITAIDIERPQRALRIGQLIRERFLELDALAERRARGESALTGVPTGLDSLDNLLSGIQPGIVTVLAGRPAMGKSALALGIADSATAHGFGVHVFSLEDARSAYADRSLARTARVPSERIRTCNLKRGDMSRLAQAATRLVKRERWLYEDVSDISPDALVRAVRRERAENQTQLVVVDYLQLLRRPSRCFSVHDATTQNLEILARAAKHDGIAYLVLSQLSRSVEKREDKRPMLSDLRESGSIEERAKCILAMYRGAYYGPPKEGIDYDDGDPHEQRPNDREWERRADILVLKNSHGRTGYVRCEWDGPCTRIY